MMNYKKIAVPASVAVLAKKEPKIEEGERGGKFYINKKGNKVYIDDENDIPSPSEREDNKEKDAKNIQKKSFGRRLAKGILVTTGIAAAVAVGGAAMMGVGTMLAFGAFAAMMDGIVAEGLSPLGDALSSSAASAATESKLLEQAIGH